MVARRVLVLATLTARLVLADVTYSYDNAGRLIGATYSNGKVVSYAYDPAGNLSTRVVGSDAAPVVNATVNGASFVAGGIVPGELATIFGLNLTSSTGVTSASSLPLPPALLNVAVMVNGSAAPLFAIANVNGQQQINFQVPWEIAGQSTATIAVVNNGLMSSSVSVPVLSAQPGIFAYAVGGNSFGAILHADYQLADSAHPATAGEIVLVYCTGLGTVSGPPKSGAASSGQTTTVTPAVTIGGVSAKVSFSGLAPGFVGLNQINVQIPAGLSKGNQAVVIKVNGASSPAALLPTK